VIVAFFTYFVFFVQGSESDEEGHFIVSINPHLSFLLCSPSEAELEDSIIRLVNINDVLGNDVCIESSKFELSRDTVTVETDDPLLLRKRTTSDGERPERSIKISSSSPGVYHWKLGSQFVNIDFVDPQSQRIPFSPNSPPFILSDEYPLDFTFVPLSESPLISSSTFTTDVAASGHWDMDDLNECSRTFPAIGKRVQMDGKMGIITYHIMAANSYLVEFRDGSIGWYDDIDFDTVHVQYPVGTMVDAYWPADRLKLTNLADVMWPAMVTNYSNTSDSYTLRYEDGSVHPSIPSIYIRYPQRPCIDDRSDCPVLATDQQCRLNPSFTMIHCQIVRGLYLQRG
jgi:hypothetical protein